MLSASHRALILRSGRSRLAIRGPARRNLATPTSGELGAAQSVQAPLGTPPKPRRFFRKFLLYTSLAGITFYAGSTVVALNNERYSDFFEESVPLGQSIIEFAEDQGWDESLRLTGLPKRSLEATRSAYHSVEETVKSTIGSTSTTAASVQEKVQKKAKQVVRVVSSASAQTQENVEKGKDQVQETAKEASKAVLNFTKEVGDLVGQAEKALGLPSSASGSKPDTGKPTVQTPSSGVTYFTPAEDSGNGDKIVWSGPLPLGHELPYGYAKPAAQKKSTPAKDAPPPSLPLVAPAVKDLSASEPIIAQIASSIDGLANMLRTSPASATGAKDILDTAQIDLFKLGERINVVKKEEKAKLEAQLEQKAKEYSKKLQELEVDSQDKLDQKEEGYKAMLEEQKQGILKSYREKLAAELESQSEIINQRLKEEVTAQGIEMQRRWIREVKVRVEQERGGRLAKLDSLATDLKKLSNITLDNSAFLDENVQLHTLWSALRALSGALEAPSRKPFVEELRVLKNAAGAREDEVIRAAMDTLERSNVANVGVEPYGDLVTWFTTSVAPRVEGVAFVPDSPDAGVLSYLASNALSTFRFKRQGLVDGADVSSVVARATHYLNEKDLDSAARELNQLNGAPKELLADWLAAARKRLEVEQALTIIKSQATLSSLLVT